MVTSCVAYGCTYRYKKESGIGMYQFPKDVKRRDMWIRALKRANWKPSATSRICGKHFQTGKPSSDKNHPDYVPTVFSFSCTQKNALLYEKRKITIEKKRRNESTANEVRKRTAAEGLLLLQQGQMITSMNCSELSTLTPETRKSDTGSEDLEELREKLKFMERKVNTLEMEKNVQNEKLKSVVAEMNLLRAEKVVLHETVLSLKPTDSILNSPESLTIYTGLSSLQHFNWLVKLVINETSSDFLSRETQLLIVLMRLKLNLLACDLACRFKISNTSVHRILKTWLPLLGGKLRSSIVWPDKRSLRKDCPASFRNTEFKKTVCIIDCTEVSLERLSTQTTRSQTWSNYKNSQTVKFLVGITPSGIICFLSYAFGGRASDKQITLQSGFLNHISKNDLVLADRGFNMEEYFREKGAKLVVPSFTKGKQQLSKEEVIYSKKVSNVRIHVERVIRQIKRYKILQTKIPANVLVHIDSIMIICAALSNMASSIIS